MNKDSIIKTINNEKLDTNELAELFWLLNKDQYKERPVTIEEFYSSKEFVAEKWPNIFPLWKKTLKEIFPTPFNAPYNEVLISAAAGSGKEQDLSSKLLTPKGYINMGDVTIGQELLDGYGNITKVTEIYPQGKKPVYEIILEDKSRIKVGLEHINHVFKDGLPYNIVTKDLFNCYKDYKIAKWNDKQEYYNITDIKYLKDDYCQCIMVDSPYHTYISDYEIITHNTVTATLSMLYDIYKLGCLKNPCEFYQLSPGTMIIMAIFSATAATTKVNWEEITQGIEACPWIKRKIVDKRGVERKIGPVVPVEVIPGIFVQTGSKFQHSMGKAIFSAMMDEAAFGGANKNDSQKSYNELSSRIKTRFSKWGSKGNTPGQLFLISSPKEAGDFMQYRIEESQKAGASLTKIMQNIATWDADPDKDSDDKFTVFIGNENKEPCIYEQNEEVPIEEMDYLIYPPMRFYEEFKKDLLISIMNYGGITTTSDMALFKSPTVLNDAFILNNPFQQDVITLPFDKMDKQLIDFCDLTYFKDIRHPDYNRFIHIDAAYSTNTLDVYGLAAGYCILTDNTIINEQHPDLINEEDAFSKKDRQYFIDFAVGITAPKGQEVSLTKVQDFIEYLIKKCNYPVACISADQFQSKQTLQNLQTKGFNTEYISVDRTRDPYLFLRYLIHNKQVSIAKNDYLKLELRKLRDDGKKIDHPVACFVGDTKIKLVDGRSVSINDLMIEQEYKQNWVYTFNEQTKKIEPKKIKHVFQSGITKNLVKVTLDNGEVITCTPEHLFMLRDGSYEEIQNLTPGTSLMPLYTRVSDKGLKGYRLYYEPMEDKWHYEHRSFGNPDKINNVIHHCNYNKLDNTPTNLLPVTPEKHRTIHNNQTMDYKKSGQSVSLYHQKMKDTKEYKLRNEKISQKVREHNKQVFESLTEEQKQLKLNKLKEKTAFIEGIEQYFKVDYNELSVKEKRSYSQKYNRILHPEITENRSKKLSEAHKQGKFKKIREVITQKRWITNGIENKYIFKTEEIPEGYWAGRTMSEETKKKLKIANSHSSWTEEQKQAYSKLQRELTSNRMWITNGTEDKYIIKNSPIPEGFKLGRCKVGKNHKIVSIEFITKPCRVYDLEIEDNHNFALDAGVIVHNSHKDIADAVAGCLWNCANSTELMSASRVAKKILNPISYTPIQSQSMELMEFERLKQQYATGLFKGL